MTAAATPANRIFNALLRDCPDLRRRAVTVQPAVGSTVFDVGQRLSHVYFPTGGVLSVLVQLADGSTVEAATIGNEGFLGLAVWFGLHTSPDHVVQQVGGELQRVPAAAFCSAIEGSRRARRLFKHFAAYSLRAGHQQAVCNAHHALPPRLCRALLTASDRAGSRALDISQALLAERLGVRRQGVSEALSQLAQRGLVDVGRGSVRLLDRRALEARACECYGALGRLYDRLVEPAL